MPRKTRFFLLALSFVGVFALVRWSQTFLGEGAILVYVILLGAWVYVALSTQRRVEHYPFTDMWDDTGGGAD